MQRQKPFLRAFFFFFLLTCVLTGLVGTINIPVNAAPRLANALDVVINEVAWAGTQAFDGDESVGIPAHPASAQALIHPAEPSGRQRGSTGSNSKLVPTTGSALNHLLIAMPSHVPLQHMMRARVNDPLLFL